MLDDLKRWMMFPAEAYEYVRGACVREGNVDTLSQIPPEVEDRESLERIKSFDSEEFARRREQADRRRLAEQRMSADWPVDMNPPTLVAPAPAPVPRPDTRRVAAIAAAIGGSVLTDKDYETWPIEKKW